MQQLKQSSKVMGGGGKKFLLLPLLVLMLCQVGTTTDNNFLSVSANSLITNLGANFSDISLANTVYALCAGVFMIPGGLLGIIIKLRNNLRLGIILAIIGEIILALSPNMGIFIWVGRICVGLGASVLIPSVLGLIAGVYQGKDRAFAFGAIGAATGIGMILAPIVAGIIIDAFGFRFAFGFLGLYFIILLIGTIFIPDVISDTNKLRFDYAGTIIASLGLFLFIIGVSKISTWGLITPINSPFDIFGISPALPCIILGFILLVFLIPLEAKIEAKYNTALIPKSFIHNGAVRNGLYGCAMIFFGLGSTIILTIPYFLQVANLSATLTGISSAPLGLFMIVVAFVIPKVFPDINRQKAVRISYVLIAISCLIISFGMEINGVNFWIYIGLAMLGGSMGILSSQASTIVTEATNKRDAEQSGGIQAATRNIGEAICISLIGMFLTFLTPVFLDYHLNSNSSVSTQTRDFMLSHPITFGSNENFKKHISTISDTDKAPLESTYEKSRLEVSRMSIYFVGIISLLALFGTSHIPGRRSEKK